MQPVANNGQLSPLPTTKDIEALIFFKIPVDMAKFVKFPHYNVFRLCSVGCAFSFRFHGRDTRGVMGCHNKQEQTVLFEFACSRKYARGSNLFQAFLLQEGKWINTGDGG